MGLLDDAIREHLELKRRRGADPGEVAREEAEALGPVRRGEVDLDQPAAARAEVADVEDVEEVEEPPQREELPFDDVPHVHDDELEDEAQDVAPHGDPLGEAALGHHGPAPVDEHAEPEDELDPTPPHGDPMALQATREFAADEVSDALGDEEPETEAAAADPDVVPADSAPSADVAAGDPDVVPADDEGEDVLEETPEFLQETPEHDRLWFEQKPPKDFDF